MATRSATGEARCQFFSRAEEKALRASEHRKAVERYIRAYVEIPESEEEIAEAMALAQDVFARLDREDGGWSQGGETRTRPDP